MSVPSQICDGGGTKNFAKVTTRGQLVTAPLEFSNLIFQNLSVDDVAENFFEPIAGKRLVITDVIADASRDVGVNGATVDIFETDAIDSEIIDKQLFQFDMPKQTDKVLTSLNVITTEGKFINAKTDDNNVLLSIGGYFVDV